MEQEKNRIMPGTLYLVGTPIGNLADLSERARKTLAEVDFIAAEDTRNTAKLLSLFHIRKELISYYEHNKRERGEILCARMKQGESCALVTDAGMPAVSDPGEDLVRLCCEKGIPVTAVPGPTALITALTLSGLATGRFCFEGFLTTARGERKKRLQEIRHERRTMIFYEAPHKLITTLRDLYEVFGDRPVAICRELTKLNEEIIHTTLGQAQTLYTDKSPRGEYVLILSGEAELYGEDASPPTQEENSLQALPPQEHVRRLQEAGMSRMDAIKQAAKERGMRKSQLYQLLTSDRND